MIRIAVNGESARVGGTRAHLRAFLAAADDPRATFLPLFRDPSTGTASSVERAVRLTVEAPLSLRDRLRWERHELVKAISRSGADVLLQPSNVRLLKRIDLPQVHILHNLAPLVTPTRFASGRLLARLLLLRRLTHSALRRADGVIFLSQTAHDIVVRAGWRGRGVVIRPGLDRTPRVAREREQLIVVVAHLFRYKRVEDAIEGFARSGLAAEGFRLEVLGSPFDSPYADGLRRSIIRPSLRGSVSLLGGQPPSAVEAALARAAVVVQPSSIENAPQVVYEAIASDTPIVASDIPAHAELLGTGLYPVGDVDGLARELCAAAAGELRNQTIVEFKSWREVAIDIANFCADCV